MKFSLARVEQWNLGLSASAVAASLALATPHFATSLAAGALLEALNLGALRRSALQFFAGRMTRSWTGAFALRFLALAAAIFLTLQAGANPIALLIGLSIAMPAVLIDAWLNRPPILDPATLPVFLDDEAGEDGDAFDDVGGRWQTNDERPAGLSLTGELFPTHLTPRAPGANAFLEARTSRDPLSDTHSEIPSETHHSATPHSAPADTAPDETSR
ncbi:MAG: hypothetical protein R3F21_25235 [Myxococcota bacterium]